MCVVLRKILVSVGKPALDEFENDVNYRAERVPTRSFLDSGAHSGPATGLSLGKEATCAPKTTCFPAYYFADLRRLRAPAPWMVESAIGSSGSRRFRIPIGSPLVGGEESSRAGSQ